ncbi:MAG: SCP2 sterol-binding domain-containing protein [Lachnospiraceae bacterium]|nr:SCP2 sterol-binding domain-containing protein [Lachnospiraceae bacterium]
MKINIYYGGRGIVGDPTISVLNRMQSVLEDINVRVQRFHLYEEKRNITALPNTLNDADGVILASTVEWHGIGGYMYEFLDACWLYGNKERISQIYMCPVVMSTTYGEREGKLDLTKAWEILGGKPCSGICGYVKDSVSFELNQSYMTLIEKKTENIYRTISQKTVSLPASNQAVRQMVSAAPTIDLTPQESEQLSKYASDENYIQTQKEDIRELASRFRTLLDNDGVSPEEQLISDLRKHFRPQKNFSAIYKMIIKEIHNPLIIDVSDDRLDLRYGTIENPSVVCKLESDRLNDILAGRMTFLKAFMDGDMKSKGDFKTLRMLDTIFDFGMSS